MEEKLKLWVHFILATLFFFSPSTSLTVETEALLQFKKQLKDPFNTLESWKPDSKHAPCDFIGITCDKNSHLVTHISLENKSFLGEISPSISALKSLTSLVLASNTISGSLPFELVNCSNLEILNTTGNELTGSITDLSSLRNLRILDLSFNYFSGRFPDWVVNLKRLTALGLGQNDYNEGQIPENIGNLKNLTWFYLPGSNFWSGRTYLVRTYVRPSRQQTILVQGRTYAVFDIRTLYSKFYFSKGKMVYSYQPSTAQITS